MQLQQTIKTRPKSSLDTHKFAKKYML